MDNCIVSNGEVSTTQHPQTTTPTIESTKEKARIKMDNDCIDSDGELSYTKKNRDSVDNVPVFVSEEEETQMESEEDEEKDSKAAPAPTIEGEEPCVSPPVDEEDNDNEEDNDDDTDKNDDDKEDTDVKEEEDIFDFDLNDIEGMSE